MRYLVAAASTGLMAVLGAVYGWSLFAQPLAAAFGWSATTTTWAFALAIFYAGALPVMAGVLALAVVLPVVTRRPAGSPRDGR
jgi:hypothetical protein